MRLLRGHLGHVEVVTGVYVFVEISSTMNPTRHEAAASSGKSGKRDLLID